MGITGSYSVDLAYATPSERVKLTTPPFAEESEIALAYQLNQQY